MLVAHKLAAREKDPAHTAPVTLAFIGDSVTQGCFECQYDPQAGFFGTTQPNESYVTKLQSVLQLLCPHAQLNIINAGVGGDTAQMGLARFPRDVAPYQPDLVVVAFGLNDSAAAEAGIAAYTSALTQLFAAVKALGAECIYLTPNLMNAYVSPHLKDPKLVEAAQLFMSSCLDAYVTAGREAAAAAGVPVCDVYAKWQTLQKTGVDTTELLSNKLNHPVRPMHWLPAWLLADTIFEK